jgi:hypothetical protein
MSVTGSGAVVADIAAFEVTMHFEAVAFECDKHRSWRVLTVLVCVHHGAFAVATDLSGHGSSIG